MGECMLTRRGGAGGGGKYVDHIEVTTPPTKTAYISSDSAINTSGLTAAAVYTDGSTEDITSYVTKNTYLPKNTLNVVVNRRGYVTFPALTKDGIIEGMTAFYPITIRGYVYSLGISTSPKTSYKVGEALDITGLVVKTYISSSSYQSADAATYYNKEAQAAAGDSPSSYSTPYDGFILSIPDGTVLTENDTTVTVYTCRYRYATGTTTQIKSTSFTITVERPVEKIEITTPPKLAYRKSDLSKYVVIGADVILNGMAATITYEDGTTENVAYSSSSKVTFGYVLNPSTLSDYGDYALTCTATYKGVSTSQAYTLRVRNSFGAATDEQRASMLEEAYAGTIDIYDFWKVGEYMTASIGTIPAGGTGGVIPSMSAYENATSGTIKFYLLDANCKGFTLADTGEKPKFIVGMAGSDGLLGAYAPMLSNTNQIGWSNSALRPWCNSNFKNALPTEVAALFKQFKWSLYESSSYPYLVESTDYFAVAPETAVYGTIYSTSKEGNLYERWEYHKNNGSTKFHGVKNGTSTSFSSAPYWTSSLYYSKSPLTTYASMTKAGGVTNTVGTATATNYISVFGCI